MTDWSIASSIRAVPPALVARARRVRAGELVPPRPRHSSTVLLLRDGAAGLEVYVIRRRQTMAFAAGMYAFPGGALDRADLDAEPVRAGPSLEEWCRLLGLEPSAESGRLAKASVCGAVRETFEEAGVLLAGPTTDSVVEDTTGPDYEADRLALVGHALSLTAFLARRGLVLRDDLLAPWARWITPRADERRFDTRFYVAALPAGQITKDQSEEADRVAWTRPAEILAAVGRGEMQLMPPTYFTVRGLLPYGTVAEALAAARAMTIEPVMPDLVPGDVRDDGETDARWVFPGEPGHPGAYDEGEVR